MDTRPKLCVYTRPNFVHGYASQINVPIRVPNELFIKVRNEYTRTCTHMYTCIRVPTSCMYTRPNFVYGYASQLECLYDFYVNSMVFYGFLCEFYEFMHVFVYSLSI